MHKKQTNQVLQFDTAHIDKKLKEMKNTKTDTSNMLVFLALLWD
jgi:hypothetical protein